MDEQHATTTPKDEKHSINWGFILWPLVILALYVLSSGPVLMMDSKGRLSYYNKLVWRIYAPLEWAYFRTPLHKPLGMYLHLWVPKDFGKNGEPIR
jgi:hypothetical protein